MPAVKFTPSEGAIYTHKCGPKFRCIIGGDAENPHDALMRNIRTGWEIVAHGCAMYPTGDIDWDYVTHGHFTKQRPNEAGEY